MRLTHQQILSKGNIRSNTVPIKTPIRLQSEHGKGRGISIFAIEFKLWISIFSRECVVSYRVAGRSQGEGKSFTQIGEEEGKIEFMHTYAFNRQTDVSPKWKSEQSHKFPSTLNTQNILCSVCRSKLVFVSNLGLVFDVGRVHTRRMGGFSMMVNYLRSDVPHFVTETSMHSFQGKSVAGNSKQLVWQTF